MSKKACAHSCTSQRAHCAKTVTASPAMLTHRFRKTWSSHVTLVICAAFFFIHMSNCVPLQPSTRTSWKLDHLFYNSSTVVGDRAAIIERVLTSLIRFGYLSRSLLVASSSNNRPLLDVVEVPTVQRALARYQQMMRLPVTAVVDGATLYEQSVPRCGNKDIASPIRPRYLRRRVRRWKAHRDGLDKWNTTRLTYRILNYPKRSLTPVKVHRVLRRAVNAWARHSGLTFTEIRDPNVRADIRFRFGSRRHGDGIPFDGEDGVLAHAFYPKSGSLSGDVHFDNDENWTDETHDGKNLMGIAVHELGHSLGLEHSNKDQAIMFGIFIGYQRHFRLHQDDIEGIQELYGPPEPNKQLEEDDDYHTVPPIIPTTPAPTTLKPGIPHVCETPVNAILSMREYETHVFYDRFFWRVTRSETGDGFFSYELKDPPRPFTLYWRALPANLDRIDAAYERQDDKNFMFFRGNRFWILTDNNNLKDYYTFPKEGRVIQELGLPASVKKVDTLFVWGYQPQYGDKTLRKTFLFAGGEYWQFNESEGQYGAVKRKRYPKRIADIWRNLPTPIDAAYTHVDGETYFFKGYYYYSFNNRLMKVRDGYPKRNKLSWLGCTVNMVQRYRNFY